MNKKLELLTTIGMSAAMLGIDLDKLAGRGKVLTRPTKEPLSEKNKILKYLKLKRRDWIKH